MKPFKPSISNSIASSPDLLSMSSLPRFLPLAPLHQTLRSSIPDETRAPVYWSFFKSPGLCVDRRRCGLRSVPVRVSAMDEDSMDTYSFLEESDMGPGGYHSYIISSSEGEESDSDPFLDPNRDVELPARKNKMDIPDSALTVAAHRFASIHRGHRRKRIRRGVWNNMGFIAFVVPFLLFVDWCSWRIVRIPLGSFYLTQPFLVSAVLSASAGWIYIPLVDSMKEHQIQGKEIPITHSSKRETPTMGGLFFIPVGVIVARCIVGNLSNAVYGSMLATVACAAVGLLDDCLSWVKNHRYGLSGWTKFFLLVVVGTGFSLWMNSAKLSTPYNMKFLVPFPAPLGLIYFGKFYLALTTFSYAAMGTGVNLVDRLDGLAGGTAASAFLGMAVAVLPICPELSIFGASMAGACVGFLVHNRYRASIFMGDIGSLALGGALAAMASCTGMFLPLFISSGVFILEVMSAILQVLALKARLICGTSKYIHRVSPLHRQLELCGMREPVIVAIAYVISCSMALCAGYVGLISA
ncbi:hypothetical protein J5N97_007722 [Dioscorea zingiberensis]|uniref:Uncharacterized protein n=1 Tax=Dioscorea zingiberensis TaxID=325984 RepID=A0A9D5DCF6_9LILI|nr:hypothetical protein J5N97_007722 [Dioscorea zingiberensis]